MSKVTPMQSKGSQQHQQKQSIINNMDVLRYAADNFYNQNNTEDFLYEKDGNISKMMQFDYKVHKPIKAQKHSKKNGSKKERVRIPDIEDGTVINI